MSKAVLFGRTLRRHGRRRQVRINEGYAFKRGTAVLLPRLSDNAEGKDGEDRPFETTTTSSRVRSSRRSFVSEILLIADKTILYSFFCTKENETAVTLFHHQLHMSLIQRRRIWKSAAIRNLLAKNLEMQMCATQLGGPVAATSFQPITWSHC